jgi:hypothetical protein
VKSGEAPAVAAGVFNFFSIFHRRF